MHARRCNSSFSHESRLPRDRSFLVRRPISAPLPRRILKKQIPSTERVRRASLADPAAAFAVSGVSPLARQAIARDDMVASPVRSCLADLRSTRLSIERRDGSWRAILRVPDAGLHGVIISRDTPTAPGARSRQAKIEPAAICALLVERASEVTRSPRGCAWNGNSATAC